MSFVEGGRHVYTPAPDPESLERIQRLWDELADFDASSTDEALLHLLGTLAGLISAQNAYWLGVVRVKHDDGDRLRGWRPRIIRYLHPADTDQNFARQAIRGHARGLADESTIAHARQAGVFRASVIRDLVPPEWFEGDFHKDSIEPRRIVDMLFVVFPVNDAAECYYGFHRKSPALLFERRDLDLAAFAIRGLKWFQRRVMLSHGLLIAQTPLTPAERRVLHLLLTELSEKEIASKLNLTASTAHSYITNVLRKFGTAGRPALTALWLGKGQDA